MIFAFNGFHDLLTHKHQMIFEFNGFHDLLNIYNKRFKQF